MSSPSAGSWISLGLGQYSLSLSTLLSTNLLAQADLGVGQSCVGQDCSVEVYQELSVGWMISSGGWGREEVEYGSGQCAASVSALSILRKGVCELEAEPWAETQGRMQLARSSYSRRWKWLADLSPVL